MAEQSRHDVVNQTRSGGEPSPSDVPASKPDKDSARGDAGEFKLIAINAQTERLTNLQLLHGESLTDILEVGKPEGPTPTDNGRQGPALLASRALELNGLTPTSDGGEDAGSLGGSESDTSRTDGRHHTRTGSVKKPTSFKPVSFTKFSIPKAPGSISTSKVGDKVPPLSTSSGASSQPSTRPRLVAKSTSVLRDPTSKPMARGMKNGGASPDPIQVWNKNRPAQPPPSKHLTDEELKQQYGIHMTSRIQEDGSGTEAKWADIDDDEDDWAPETIEWNDGTKISLTHTENAPAPAQDSKTCKEIKDAPPPMEQSATNDSNKVLGSKSPTSVGPNATILRLGANAERQQQAKASNLLKGSNEKPTLTAKTPAPVPVKSPWATLPPVDKVPPVIPPVQQAQVASRPPQGQESVPGPVPAKEIAADDFNRSWRDGQHTIPRELYNSQSGRYEPVSDTRNGLPKNEQQLRTPSVLQRPSHIEFSGPAEPSPAFQTHRTSNQDGAHWTRRRTSSNVSGGSGSFGRRMSLGRPDIPAKINDSRRGSQVNGVIERPTSPRDISYSKGGMARGLSPNQQSAGSAWQPRTSTNANSMPQPSIPGAPQTTSAPQTTGSSAPEEPAIVSQVPEEDPIAMQQRIMKEKRLEARQRRLEQEEREEAERRERIRLKLEALGPPPEKEKPKPQEQQATAKVQSKEATATTPTTVNPVVQSPPKPPVPEPTGEPKQYGMMKVHHPESVKRLVTVNERTTEKPAITGTHGRRAPSPARDAKLDGTKTDGLLPTTEISHPQSQEQHCEQATDEKSSQWRGNLNPSSSYSPWGTGSKLGSHTTTSANPWKPLSNDKTLGNGTFDRNLSGFPPKDIPLRGHLSLADQPHITPPSTSAERMSGPQPFPSSSRVAPENQSSLTPLQAPDTRHPVYEPLNPISRPGPIGPPVTQPGHRPQESRQTTAWNNFHAVAAKKDAEDSEKFRRELTARRDDGPTSMQISFNETWRQVRTGDQAGQRQVISVARTNDNGGPLSPLHAFDNTVDALPFADNHSRPFPNVTGRGSRFFPPTVEAPKRSVGAEDGHARSPSPPPPEEISSHPAFTGDSHRPLVHLPTPKPVVKLPPKTSPTISKPASFASMAAATPPRVVPQPIASMWQEKINVLFGKKGSTEKKHSLAVASATKEPLDVQSQLSSAAVSFPQNADSEPQKDVGKVTSKEVEEEEEMFEDREAGSLPVVRVPIMAPPAAWRAALPPPTRLRSKYLKPMQVLSIESFLIGLQEKDSSGNLQISIRLPGWENLKLVTLPKRGGSHRPRQRGSSNFRPRKNTKSREPPAIFNGSQGSKKSNSSNPTKGSPASPRGTFGQPSWGSRVPSVVH